MTPVPAAAEKNIRNATELNSFLSMTHQGSMSEFISKANDRSWKTSLLLPILGGVILSFAYPRMDFWFLAWFALVPLWIFIDSVSNRWLAVLGSFLFSFSFFAISVHWLRFVTLFGWGFVLVWESLFYMAMGYLTWSILHRNSCKVCFIANLSLLFVLPGLWVLAEWVRSEIPIMGFGWNLLAYSQTENNVLIQSAKIVGAYGISFLVAFANAFIFLLWRLLAAQGSPVRRFLILGVASVAVFGVFFSVIRYGYVLLGKEGAGGPTLRVSMIQGNIPQEEKWDPKYKKLIIDKYLKLTEMASYDGPDLIVWPEAAFPGYYNLDRDGDIPQAAQKMNIPILFGGLTAMSETEFYNSIYLVSADGMQEGRYDKIRLVPFGEYIPFHAVLFPLESLARDLGVSDFSPGRESLVFRIPMPEGQKKNLGIEQSDVEAGIGPLICFENMFQDLVRKLCWKGAEVLCVITNDAWFRDSSAPYQHLQASVFRSIETGRWMIHCANTGVSAFVSPKGEITDRIKDQKGEDLFVMGGLTRPVILSAENTPYLSFGYLFPYIALLMVIQGFLFTTQKKEKKRGRAA